LNIPAEIVHVVLPNWGFFFGLSENMIPPNPMVYHRVLPGYCNVDTKYHWLTYMSTCHCIISHNFTINRWFSHEFPILSCPDSLMYRKTMVSGPPLGVFAVSSWLCSPSHWRPPPLFAQNSLEIHGMKKTLGERAPKC
jgi:hypothetical protein